MKQESFCEKYRSEIERLYLHMFGAGGSEKDHREKMEFIESAIDIANGLMQQCNSVEDLKQLLIDERICMDFVRVIVLIVTGKFMNLSDEELSTCMSSTGWRTDLELSLDSLLTLKPGEQN